MHRLLSWFQLNRSAGRRSYSFYGASHLTTPSCLKNLTKLLRIYGSRWTGLWWNIKTGSSNLLNQQPNHYGRHKLRLGKWRLLVLKLWYFCSFLCTSFVVHFCLFFASQIIVVVIPNFSFAETRFLSLKKDPLHILRCRPLRCHIDGNDAAEHEPTQILVMSSLGIDRHNVNGQFPRSIIRRMARDMDEETILMSLNGIPFP